MSDFPPYDGTTPRTPLYDQTSSTVPPANYPTNTSTGGASEKASQAKDEAASVAGDAQDATKHVASVTKDQASHVASEAKSQAKDLYAQATSELKEQAGTQQQKVADGLRSVSDELSSMAENGSGVAGELVRNLSGRAGSVAGWLDGRDPGSLLDEVKSFAARRPGTFIAIAAGAGLLAGRLTKALAAEAKNNTPSTDVAHTPSTTAPAPGYERTAEPVFDAPVAPAASGYVEEPRFDDLVAGDTYVPRPTGEDR
jgi:hypothetical protein